MVMRRKEAKDYGTKKLIEGHYKPSDTCLIIEDVVTSGSSILETVRDLERAGIRCTDAVVLLNREQGGEMILKEHGIKMHALLGLSELMEILKEAGCVGEEQVGKVREYLGRTKVDSGAVGVKQMSKFCEFAYTAIERQDTFRSSFDDLRVSHPTHDQSSCSETPTNNDHETEQPLSCG